jgi:hypothetical protein
MARQEGIACSDSYLCSTTGTWEDGAYSVQGAAEAIGVYPGTIHKWLKTGRIHGKLIRKATPWKAFLGVTEITQLRNYVQ